MNEADFYTKMGVPPPKLTPAERAREKLAWRNERVLYRRTCDKTGSLIVSIHSSDKPYPVFANHVWWSDAWDAESYAREFDFSRPFFDQFIELYLAVPQQAAQHSKSENCDYTNQSQCNKDCYLIVASNYSRDCLFGMWFQRCTDCVDCLYLEQSELCYEVINGTNCFECTFSANLENCSNLHFCKNCIGCKYCTGCVNLRNKEYCFYNQQCTRDEYFARLKALAIDSYEGVKRQQAAFAAHALQFPCKFYIGSNIEDATGDYLSEARDAEACFNCRHIEHVKYCRDAWKARNSFDLIETLENDFCIGLEGCWDNVDCGFSMKLNQTSDVWYSSHCFSSKNLFGSVGLRHAEHCILNKRYKREAYFSLRERIVEHMKRTGEWGEYFPGEMSPFGYNETVAHEYFPLDRESGIKAGWKWKDEETVIAADRDHNIPDSIRDVTDDILDRVLACAETSKPYRMLRQELTFYRKLGIPIPRLHPDVRHIKRMALRNPRVIYSRSCNACSAPIQTTFAPDRPEQVLCEDCFLGAV
jgi:hypothetical protein